MLLKRISLLWGDHHQRPRRFRPPARHGGVAQVNVLLRNFLLDFCGFAAFCFTLAVALPPAGGRHRLRPRSGGGACRAGGDLPSAHAPPARASIA
jgi:hypothetical protein